MKTKSEKLTIKQEKYCNERVKGKSQRAAYKAAFNSPNCKDSSIDVNACKLEKTTKIQQRLNYLRSLDSKQAIVTKEDIVKDLSLIAIDNDKSDTIRIKAYETIAKIQGYNESNTNVTLSGGVLLGKDKAQALKDYIQSLHDKG